ncbi:ParB/RepB/Spo0J family partition protein [Streptomyces sp. NPDC053048]|uniref:ParB/RepB/Spo0J family partition protein n=1 Tax=Streptomyces sp. NPDC053048 TaxID=3365694 RepID=UPI0037D5AA97
MTVPEPEQQQIAVLSPDALLPADSPRVEGEDLRHVQTLAALDVPLPPIVVHRATLRVVDGMHRLRAARLRGDERIAVRFFDGSPDDAFVYAVRANILRGLPLTQADRSAAAERIIRSHPHWSDRLIASATGLAASTVAAVRRRSAGSGTQLPARTGRDGRVRPLNAAEGRRRAGALIEARPQASLREIAGIAGIAVGTARDVRLRIRQGRDPVPKKLRDAENRGRAGEPAVRAAAPASTAPQAATARPVATASVSTEPLLRTLRTDPSLRFTEGGRALLHLLSAHAMGGERWRGLLDAVPAHRRAAVAQAARHSAEAWLRFAGELERRTGGSR